VQGLEERATFSDVGYETDLLGLKFVKELDYAESCSWFGTERAAVDTGGEDDVGV
jgi:hypothetical protein